MPRYRKLHVKTVESLDLNDMPDDFTRLFWVLLPLQLCRNGCGVDSLAWLRSKVFPLREDVTREQIEDAFNWFIDHGMVEPYEVEGRSYFWVPTFGHYQGDTSKEAESDYPPPPDLLQSNSGVTPEQLQSRSASDADADATTDADADAQATTDPAPACLLAEYGAENAEELAANWGWDEGQTRGYFRLFAYGDPAIKGIENPIGYAISLQRKGRSPPKAQADDPDDPRRFLFEGAES